MSDSLEIPRALVAEAVATSLSRWLPAGTPLVAAVSGGADSVALAWALALQHERWPLTAVLFVDHGLRDVSAERDAAKAAAEAAHTRFIEARVTLAPGNVQASARRARYQALIATARQLDERTRVATGHTSSDQAETVLARLARGAGLPGLAGLAPCRGRLVRPLLAVSRRATRALGLPFVDDPSNASPRFQRNRLRALLEQLGDERDAVEAGLALLPTPRAARPGSSMRWRCRYPESISAASTSRRPRRCSCTSPGPMGHVVRSGARCGPGPPR